MKYRQIQKTINHIFLKYYFLKENNIKIELVYDDPNKFIGIFITRICNKYHQNLLQKTIFLNAHWILKNNKKFLKYVLMHEIVHAFDFILNDGWRIGENKNIKLHDEFFENLCLLFNFKNNKIKFKKRRLKTKRYKKIKNINLEI